MRKLVLEVALSAAFVLVPTLFIYGRLIGFPEFWDAQFLWSVALGLCWVIVAFGYFHQGLLVREKGDASEVSLLLPITVFFVQCILFVKGVSYQDWALIGGALAVNSGVVFNLYQILRAKKMLRLP